MIPEFGNLLFTIIAFIAALSVIVTVHEYGHYIIGRICGIGADVFSLGFGPVLASRVDKRGTRWQIAALPLGGYVKFKGDANAASAPGEAAALEGMSAQERRATLPGAPLWARAATVAAGPVFNFVLSTVIFAGMLMWRGGVAEPLRLAETTSLPSAYGEMLQEGDEIVALNGQPADTLAALQEASAGLGAEATVRWTVTRDGGTREIEGPTPLAPLVGSVSPKSAALAAGIEKGDVITALDGAPVATFADIRPVVEAAEGAPLEVTLWRAGETRTVTLAPKRTDLPTQDGGFETRWLIGVTGGAALPLASEGVGPLKAISAGASQVVSIAQGSLRGMVEMIAGNISSCNLSGPIGIAQVTGQAASQGIGDFIWFIGVLSTAVGLLNLFPIPVLDGGHLLFYAYEAVTGKAPSERVMQILMTAGMALLLTLMVFSLTNDLFC